MIIGGISSAAIFLWAIAFGLMLYGSYRTLFHLKKKRKISSFPSISVLKPLKGIDPGLEENLRSFFKQDYPNFELIFSLASEADSAAKVVQKLFVEFPNIQASLVFDSRQYGLNPKINNLVTAYAQARKEWILISDSNARVETDYLEDMSSHVANDVGVITSLVRGTQAQGFASKMEENYLNIFYPRGMMIANDLGCPCVLGKSMMIQKKVFDRIGGVLGLRYYLAEDFMAGVAVQRLGLKVITSTLPVSQVLGAQSFAHFWKRHLRWARIRRAQGPPAFFAELAFCSTVSGFIGAMGVQHFVPLWMSWFLFFHFSVWAIADFKVMKKVSANSSTLQPIYWVVREALVPVLWFHAISSNSVEWRGSKIRIKTWGTIEADDSVLEVA